MESEKLKEYKVYVRKHCNCPHCGKKIEVVIRPDTPYGMQVWTRKPKVNYQKEYRKKS